MTKTKYVIFNKAGEILRTIQCSPVMSKLQVKTGEFVMEGTANDATQKVEFDGFDEKGQPINPRIVDKTPEEIEINNVEPISKPLPYKQRLARLTNDGLAELLKDIINLNDRVKALEKK